MTRTPLNRHLFLSLLFLAVCVGVFLSTVFSRVWATNLTYTAPSASPFYFSEVAPNDSVTEVLAPASGPTSTAGGNANFRYFIWVPNTNITLTRIGGSGSGNDALTVSSINTNPAIGANGLLTGGAQTVQYGGTRDATAAAQAAGTYSGAYIVSARYTNAGSAVVKRTSQFRVRVLTSIGITKTADLNFGESYDSDGAYTVNATDSNTGSGTNLKGPATFTVVGSTSHSYNITLPSSTTLTTGDGVGSTKQIVVDTFTHNAGGSPVITGGSVTLKVGASRAAPIASQVTGAYSGSYSVTVYYY